MAALKGGEQVIEREILDAQVRTGEEVSAEALKTILTGDTPPQGELLQDYIRGLMRYAMESRDAEAVAIVTQAMDTDPAIDAALETTMNQALVDKPDAVYAFVRAHLNDPADPRWLQRLQNAAICSLQVAICNGDTETVISWLTLTAREPAYYELGRVLHNGILAARERAYQSEDLARQLISFASRRDGAALALLLEDETLLANLTNNIGRVLREYTGDPMMFLQNWGNGLFLAALGRAAQAGVGDLFTVESTAKLWELLAERQPTGTPPEFQPENIIYTLIARGGEILSPEVYRLFIGSLLALDTHTFFLRLVESLSMQKKTFSTVVNLLETNPRSIQDVLDRTGQAVGAGELTFQQAADLYVLLLAAREWHKSMLPVAEQLARLLHQPGVEIAPEFLEPLLDLGSEARNELVTRAVVRRQVTTLEALEDDTQLIEDLREIVSQVQWSGLITQFILGWWRGFVRDQSLARLQRFDQGCEGKRALDEMRAIVQSLVAIRKMLGQRTLQELADEVKAAYAVLEALSEAFDPHVRRLVSFDQHVIRAELDEREQEVSPHERKVLANNLKKLGQLIVTMSDNRTKKNLMRRSGEDLDRDLMTGEQLPNSGIDTMKWLAGYWGGAQNPDETAEQ